MVVISEETPASRSSDLFQDPWAFYDYKPSFRNGNVGHIPGWAKDHHRRLTAYALLSSYDTNAAREWLADVSDEDRNNRREFGDPGIIVDTTLSSLLGDDQSIQVIDPPDPETGEQPLKASDEARTQLALLLEWAEQEMFIQQMMESERTSILKGDSVYVLGWNERLSRPRLYVYDPEYYFPVLDPVEITGAYPEKIHIAYQYKTDEGTKNEKDWLRRLTWELRDEPAGRKYPWNDEKATKICWLTDATWDMEKVRNNMLDLSEAGSKSWEETDLNLDFIPVVHVPNNVALKFHYGTSQLARVLPLIDDLISTDTDLQASSATTGTPPIILSGSSAPKDEAGRIKSYGPGTVFETGDGTGGIIDTSASLDALIKFDDKQLSRLSINSRIPEALLGRVKPSEVPSGIALTLSFAPHSALVKAMRLVRDPKYRLLFKFICRMYMQDGQLSSILPAELRFGSFLPADRQETMTIISTLLKNDKPVISLVTAVRMLVEAGFPIEDAAAEVERIQNEDFKTASELLDATGDVNAARKRLGMPPAAAPGIQGPPAPSTNPSNPEIAPTLPTL